MRCQAVAISRTTLHLAPRSYPLHATFPLSCALGSPSLTKEQPSSLYSLLCFSRNPKQATLISFLGLHRLLLVLPWAPH